MNLVNTYLKEINRPTLEQMNEELINVSGDLARAEIDLLLVSQEYSALLSEIAYNNCASKDDSDNLRILIVKNREAESNQRKCYDKMRRFQDVMDDNNFVLKDGVVVECATKTTEYREEK